MTLTESPCTDRVVLDMWHPVAALEEIKPDKPIIENQVPRRLPLAPRAETPIRADKSSILYRRWLSDLGITYGVIPEAA